MNSSSSLLGARNLHIFINYGLNLFWFESLKPELLIFIAMCPDYGNDSETEKIKTKLVNIIFHKIGEST